MQDQVNPKDKWVFDSEVTAVFDDMLERSIPDYDNMRDLCFRLGKRFLNAYHPTIIDLGASRGNAIGPFVDLKGDDADYVAIEVSDSMRAELKQRFKGNKNLILGSKEFSDLKTSYPNRPSDLTLSILTIQFIPINYRQQILRNVYNNTKSGGAFLFVEKVIGDTADINSILVDTYHDHKKETGKYSDEQINRKALSLEGVLVPVTAEWNESLLKKAGFNHVECFWRSLNFAGWLAIKD